MPAVADRLEVHLVVIAKEPVPGRVKTRLTPPYLPEQAAQLAEASLVDTLDAVLATPVTRRSLVLDGAAGDWMPPGLDVIPQRGAGLDERLTAAFADAERRRGGPLLLVGMDTPQLSPKLLTAAADLLLRPAVDAVLGPASDGGWWALGLRRADAAVLLGVPMSTPETGQRQLTRLRRHGLRVGLLPTLTDVDDSDSAQRVAAQAPGARFALTLHAMLQPLSVAR